MAIMTNKVTITGSKARVVDEVQSRLDKFSKCTKAYEQARKALDELEAKNDKAI
jgi:hypothetical protein